MSWQEGRQRYIELRNQGVDAQTAFQQAFPNGITQAQAEELANEQSSSNLGAIAGSTAGALSTALVTDLARNGSNSWLGRNVGGGGSSGGASSVGSAAPEVVAARRIPSGGGLSPQEVTQQATMEALAEGASAEVAQEAGVAAGQAAAEEAGGSWLETAGDIGTYAAWAYQAYQGYQTLTDDNLTDEQKAQLLAKQVGLAVADYWTFGLASAADAWISSTGTGQKIQREIQPYDPIWQAAGAAGRIWSGDGEADDYLNLSTMGLSSVAGNALGIRELNRKSTQEYQQERMADAMQRATTDDDRREIAWQWEQKKRANEQGKKDDYVLSEESGNPLAGRKWTWEEQQNIVVDGNDITKFQGFRDLFPDWMSGYTREEREAIAEAALDSGFLVGDKGNVVFQRGTQDSIKEIAQQIKQGTWTPIRSDEQRFADAQEFLRGLEQREGYRSSWLDRRFEDVSYQLQLQNAVDEVDRARELGQLIPDWANRLLTIEHNRRNAQADGGAALEANIIAPTAEEITRFDGPPVPSNNRTPHEGPLPQTPQGGSQLAGALTADPYSQEILSFAPQSTTQEGTMPNNTMNIMPQYGDLSQMSAPIAQELASLQGIAAAQGGQQPMGDRTAYPMADPSAYGFASGGQQMQLPNDFMTPENAALLQQQFFSGQAQPTGLPQVSLGDFASGDMSRFSPEQQKALSPLVGALMGAQQDPGAYNRMLLMQQPMPQRSETLSPGIGLDGRRISY